MDCLELIIFFYSVEWTTYPAAVYFIMRNSFLLIASISHRLKGWKKNVVHMATADFNRGRGGR